MWPYLLAIKAKCVHIKMNIERGKYLHLPLSHSISYVVLSVANQVNSMGLSFGSDPLSGQLERLAFDVAFDGLGLDFVCVVSRALWHEWNANRTGDFICSRFSFEVQFHARLNVRQDLLSIVSLFFLLACNASLDFRFEQIMRKVTLTMPSKSFQLLITPALKGLLFLYFI